MPMLITDAQAPGSPVLYANAAFLRMLSREPDEVIGRGYAAVAGDHADPEVKARIEAALASFRSSTDELLFHAKDGREVWVSQLTDPMVEDGRVVRHFVSFYDITDRVRREQGLQGEKEALERRVAARTLRLEQAKGQLEEEVIRRLDANPDDARQQGQKKLWGDRRRIGIIVGGCN